MANTARKRMNPGYTRPPQDENSRHWRDLFDNPEKWDNPAEVEALIDKIAALVSEKDFDSHTIEKGMPERMRFDHPEHKYAMIITEDCRDQLKANGHTHYATFSKGGYEYYLFIFTWDLNADLANYFDYGIDFTTGSVL